MERRENEEYGKKNPLKKREKKWKKKTDEKKEMPYTKEEKMMNGKGLINFMNGIKVKDNVMKG